MTVPKNDKFKDYARYAEHCLNMSAATVPSNLVLLCRTSAEAQRSCWTRRGARVTPAVTPPGNPHKRRM